MTIATLTATGHLPRGFDPARRIPEDTLAAILDFLRATPSSVNVQPWRALILRGDAAKRRLADHLGAGFEGNGVKITTASHAVVLSTLTDLDDRTLQERFDREERDGRFPDPAQNAAWQGMVRDFVGLRRDTYRDVHHWLQKQTYLALGMTMVAAAELGVDTAPMEGFDPHTVAAAFGLDDSAYQPTVLLALGYRDGTHTPPPVKSRLGRDELFTTLD